VPGTPDRGPVNFRGIRLRAFHMRGQSGGKDAGSNAITENGGAVILLVQKESLHVQARVVRISMASSVAVAFELKVRWERDR